MKIEQELKLVRRLADAQALVSSAMGTVAGLASSLSERQSGVLNKAARNLQVASQLLHDCYNDCPHRPPMVSSLEPSLQKLHDAIVALDEIESCVGGNEKALAVVGTIRNLLCEVI